jgi:PAS domain-containing protein
MAFPDLKLPAAEGLGREREVHVNCIPDLQDVTEHKRAKRALRNSEDRFRRIVETAVARIWIVTQPGLTSFEPSQKRHVKSALARKRNRKKPNRESALEQARQSSDCRDGLSRRRCFSGSARIVRHREVIHLAA